MNNRLKIVVMERDTLGDDVSLEAFEEFGEVVCYHKSEPAENALRAAEADILIVNKIPMNEETLGRAAHLKLICLTATGTNNVDFAYTNARGITVCNVKGYSTNSVVQHTFALLFYVYEKLAYYDRFVKSGEYAKNDIFTFPRAGGEDLGQHRPGRHWLEGGRDRGGFRLPRDLL